jgi:hypothetical protein
MNLRGPRSLFFAILGALLCGGGPALSEDDSWQYKSVTEPGDETMGCIALNGSIAKTSSDIAYFDEAHQTVLDNEANVSASSARGLAGLAQNMLGMATIADMSRLRTEIEESESIARARREYLIGLLPTCEKANQDAASDLDGVSNAPN